MTTPVPPLVPEGPPLATFANRAWVVLWSWADQLTSALKPCRQHTACLLPCGHAGRCIPAKKAAQP